MTSDGSWYPAQAKTNPDLFRVIFDYNCRPQFWLPPRALTALPYQPVVAALTESPHGTPHLADWLNKELSLVARDWNFAEPRRRLHLLSSATLERLALYCGAALVWPRIAAVIARAEIQNLKAKIGEDVHAFAMRRARMIVPEKDVQLPEPGADLSAHATASGWRMLLTAAHDESDALHRRMELKLPAEASKFRPAGTAPEAREKAWQRVRKISAEVLTEGELKCFA